MVRPPRARQQRYHAGAIRSVSAVQRGPPGRRYAHATNFIVEVTTRHDASQISLDFLLFLWENIHTPFSDESKYLCETVCSSDRNNIDTIIVITNYPTVISIVVDYLNNITLSSIYYH